MADPESTPSHYDVLQLRSDATADEIRASFRRLARLHHSDHGADGDDGAMQRINRAYEVLSSPHDRAQYDISLRPPRASGLRGRSLAPFRRVGWMAAGLAAATAAGAIAATLFHAQKSPAPAPQLARGAAAGPDAPLSLVPARRLESWPQPPGQTRP